ncbi:hypothetical protein Jden_1979 [Jonesia denitrificans DSM 20603]|uniref:Uncharacterized protein n=1 Tax=Jonesia denitrificans (strain ATCC 14870 / DSM 20603 / BCRC 15368 / CIP 55.134 / JCM 11481 / NBRC 15587 / NCTC 10816 / Prevot 55134) TaxID=471856 RepID=C7R0F4_JONDD|nr:hypothetical protein Jden_1979 [Jonesia denitrificans DSM 20603]SQH22092.1 Uncharacterised protein [Jonesia denitrificans]
MLKYGLVNVERYTWRQLGIASVKKFHHMGFLARHPDLYELSRQHLTYGESIADQLTVQSCII